MKNIEVAVGIDCGVKTGIAIWDVREQCFIEIETVKIHEAMGKVMHLYSIYKDALFVRFEDARQRKWFGNAGREQLQGAGSIKRDSTIWSDFLTDNKIKHEAVAPKRNVTKLKSDTFQNITKWKKRTSEHSRDAAMLVYGI